MKRITLIVGAFIIFAAGVLVGASTHRYEFRMETGTKPYGFYRFDAWTGKAWEYVHPPTKNIMPERGWKPLQEYRAKIGP